MTSRIGVYAWAGMGNLGDDYLLDTAIELIAQGGHEVVLILEPNARWHSHPNLKILHWPRRRGGRRLRKQFANEINQLDYLVFAGGGWLAGDRGIREPLNWFLRLQPIQIPTIGLSLGIGPFNSISTRFLGKRIMSKISNHRPLGVRSNFDLYWSNALGYRNSELSTDLAFSADLQQSGAQVVRQGCVVALPEIQARWLKGMSPESAAEKFIANLGSDAQSALFVSFQRGKFDDYAFWSKYFPNVEKVASFSSAVHLMRSAEKVVAGRLHAGIAAVQAEVPELALIGYHHKFSVLSDLGLQVGAWGDDEIKFCAPKKGLVQALSSRSREHLLRKLSDLE